MEDFAKLRREMVERQLVYRGIKDARVLSAFRAVRREAFVPAELRQLAYDDGALPIGEGQTISQPYMAALMTEFLQLKGEEKILEVGTGSGYQTAILAELCKRVHSIERLASLQTNAKNAIAKLGYKNIEFVTGDGSEGYSKEAPYDGIIVTAGCPAIPKPLVDQLTEGGRLVIPVGERYFQALTVVTKEKGKISTFGSLGCVFVPLVGKYGWPD